MFINTVVNRTIYRIGQFPIKFTSITLVLTLCTKIKVMVVQTIEIKVKIF